MGKELSEIGFCILDVKKQNKSCKGLFGSGDISATVELLRMRALLWMVLLGAVVNSAHGWTDATCNSSFPNNLPYACNWGLACGCGYASTTAGSSHCCNSKPPGCEANADPTYKTCTSVSACYGSWTNSGSCTGCGSAVVQKQIRPCNGVGSDLTRTVTVTCGTVTTLHHARYD